MQRCPYCGKLTWSDKTTCVECGSPLSLSNNEQNLDSYSKDKGMLQYFKDNDLCNWFGEVHEWDCCTYQQHRKGNNIYLPNYRTNFQIGKDEEILFTRDTSFWSSDNQGLVITDKAIYIISDNESTEGRYTIEWGNIQSVEYKEFFFYLYNYEHEELISIHSDLFFKGIDAAKLERFVGTELAKHLTNMATIFGEGVDPLEAFWQLEDEEKYDEALEELDRLVSNHEINDDAAFHFYKGRVMYEREELLEDSDQGRFEAIDKEFLKAIDADDEDRLFTTNSYYWRACNYQLYGQHYNARNLFVIAMESTSEAIREDSEKRVKTLEENQLSEIWDSYVNIYDYKDRKFLMPINDREIAGCLGDGIDTFRMSKIPSCIKFPTGHPIANELYIGHPYNPSLYVPYSQSEEIFFLDKIHELAYLLECLGAEEITITSIKGKNVSEYANYDRSISGNATVGLYDINGNVKTEGHVDHNSNSNTSRTLTMRFDPMQKPYLPDTGLIWYDEQPQWQRLANSRLNGNMLEYNEFVSSATTKFVSESEKLDVKASAQYLWNKVGGGFEKNTESHFKESVETQWKVEVKFRSVKDFVEENSYTNVTKLSNTYSSQEQEYLENLKDFLEDDAEITPRERKMLDRIRQSLGISEERAQELEASLKPQLTEDEKEYLEMYRDYKGKGSISEKERRRLDKFANALGISDERMKELELI